MVVGIELFGRIATSGLTALSSIRSSMTANSELVSLIQIGVIVGGVGAADELLRYRA